MTVERKSLFLRGVPASLVREAKAESARRGKPLAAIVSEALAHSLATGDTASDDGALADSMRWFHGNLPALMRRYRGEFVAIVDRTVIDHDLDFDALASRVFHKLGNRSIYMPRVLDRPAEARVRSPRRSPS